MSETEFFEWQSVSARDIGYISNAFLDKWPMGIPKYIYDWSDEAIYIL